MDKNIKKAKEETSDSWLSFFGDVPLEEAVIAWTPTRCPGVGIPGRIIIIPLSEDGGDFDRQLRVTDSTGACWIAWEKWTNKERLLRLYIEAWHIVARDGLKPEDVHAALMVIPEYRNSLSGEDFFQTNK